MTDSYITVSDNTTASVPVKIDGELVTVGAVTVFRQRITAMPSGTQDVNVTNASLAITNANLDSSLSSIKTSIDSIKAKTDNLDVLLSTRTKPADSQHTTIDNASIAVTGSVSAAVSGSVSVSSAPSTAVTNANLDSSLSGIKTTLDSIKTKTDNLDVLTSTRTKPADAQHTIIDSGTTAITNANLDAAISTLAQQATLALIKAKTDNLDAASSTLATQSTLASILAKLDVALSTRLAETTYTGRMGELQQNPTPYTELDRLKTIADKLDALGKTQATDATLKQVVTKLTPPQPKTVYSF